jgi:hypothetical protein
MALSKDPGDEAEDQIRSQIEHYFYPPHAGLPTDQAPSEYIPERDYFSRYLVSKHAEDADFEPELQKLLTSLYDRQRQDAHEFIAYYRRRLNNPELDPPETREHVIEEFKREYRDLAEERDRYICDYQKAQSLRDDLQQREATLEDGLEDKPKLSH